MTVREAKELFRSSDAVQRVLHRHDPQWLTLHNRLHRYREAWEGPCGGQGIRVCVGGGAAPLSGGAVLDVHLTWGTASLVLQLPTALQQHVGLADVGFSAQGDSCAAMLLECALLEVIEPLERWLEQPLQVTSIASSLTAIPPTPRCPLSLMLDVRLSSTGASWAVPLHMDPQAAGLVADALDRHAVPARHALTALRLPMSVTRGDVQLSVAELRSLRPGDVLMLAGGAQTPVLLTLHDDLQCRVRLSGHAITLLEKPTAITP
jgi:type III secretion protein Q